MLLKPEVLRRGDCSYAQRVQFSRSGYIWTSKTRGRISSYVNNIFISKSYLYAKNVCRINS